MSGPEIRAWPRADGWTEIEGGGIMTRFQRSDQVDAYLEGVQAGLTLAGNAVSAIRIKDDRPIRTAPRSEA